jgi:hypothetical protein
MTNTKREQWNEGPAGNGVSLMSLVYDEKELQAEKAEFEAREREKTERSRREARDARLLSGF